MFEIYISVGKPKASKPYATGSTPVSSCLSLMFIKNLKTINQNTRKHVTMYTI